MVEGSTHTFSDPDGYTAAFGDTRVNLTITGAGDFAARLTRLHLQHLQVYRCRESLPRIAYISFPPERVVLSFPAGRTSSMFGGFALRNGDILFHSRGDRLHQRTNGAFEWGLISLSAEQLADCGEALIGRKIVAPPVSRLLRPARSETLRLQHLFKEACRLAEAGMKLVGRPEVARAVEQELLHAIVHCLVDDHEAGYPSAARHHHAEVMVRFEETLSKHIDHKLNLPTLCAEIGVAERTLRMCCANFLGVSPTRYILLQRLNRARVALRRADPSTASVAQIARNNQFLEFGRFAVTYRTIFGEPPSVTLHRAALKDGQLESQRHRCQH
jgi:AraC-like DNA-binding protein